MFEALREKGFTILTRHHAEAILKHDMRSAADELEQILKSISIPVAELVHGGGGAGKLTQRLRQALSGRYGWQKHCFEIRRIVDGQENQCVSHEVDHVKKFPTGTVALEIEWNNKDPFFDRDLENFKRLHGDGIISIGVIITRGASLQDGLRDLIEAFARKEGIDGVESLSEFYTPTKRQKRLIEESVRLKGSFESSWAHAFVADKFGEATTHWRKLEDRVRRGVGNPCPLLLIGIPRDVVTI